MGRDSSSQDVGENVYSEDVAVQWIAAAVVLVCLMILVADFSRRWGRPRMWIDLRTRGTWAVVAAVGVLLVLVTVIG